MSLVAAAAPVSTLLREATAQAHERAENTGFVQHLMSGRLTVEAFTALVAQHHAIYLSLEALGARVRDLPGADRLVRPELLRSPALARDLAHLSADRAAPPATAATRAYVARLDELHDLPGYAAHAYTRYLGDLSGGQIVKTMMQRHYGLGEQGLSFYTFEQIEKIPPYKSGYRAALDALDLDEQERARLVEEARAAFAFNEAVFTDLGELYPPAH
ncbi:biliverdin-producing heme oxygenase [Ruania suaedae]|uniref:biliverdin-producing heme oxygenase n=1 Tax=Ruania suaedae TaxID=2897774 RepID=UPI001E544494|nr:biliverdin-producing heme oxygenase [Ruania suaedae]UFU02809.1 biliverdin-producing heme oxygenase [Ruania suaedae]